MLTNADITIYNRKFDKKTGFDLWNRTVIRDVHVYVDHKVSVGDTGLNSADVYKIRIPDNVGNADLYLPPEEYAALENPSGHWTILITIEIVLKSSLQIRLQVRGRFPPPQNTLLQWRYT